DGGALLTADEHAWSSRVGREDSAARRARLPLASEVRPSALQPGRSDTADPQEVAHLAVGSAALALGHDLGRDARREPRDRRQVVRGCGVEVDGQPEEEALPA